MRILLLSLALAAPAAAQTAPPAWKANCQVCHQADGKGLAGQFPRLAGRASTIAEKPAGRAYLAGVVIHGMAGRVTVDDKPIIGVMPGFTTLSDADLAAALTFAAKGGKGGPFKPYEIAAVRKALKPEGGMIAVRAALVADGTIP